MIRDLITQITYDQVWDGVAVLVLTALAIALIVLSYTAWRARND
ncbi:hypothetical protein ACWGB8_01565 [Kitasatospora sp. NPDC054939]